MKIYTNDLRKKKKKEREKKRKKRRDHVEIQIPACLKKVRFCQVLVIHICNLSFLGGRDQGFAV
jgi:hypothetical protein